MDNITTLNVKQFRGQGFMTVVKYNYTGDLLFIADKDSKFISMVSVKNNSLIGTFEGHNGVIWALAISPDDKFLISCSGDMSFIVWDIETGNILNKISETGIPKYVSIRNNIVLISCDPISKRSKPYTSIYYLDELITGITNQIYKTIENENNKITTVSILNDDLLLKTFDNGFIRKQNFKTNEIILEKQIHDDVIKSIHFSNDKTKFLTSSLDTTAKIIDVETFNVLGMFKSSVPINTAIFTPDNLYVLLGGGIEAMLVAKTKYNDLTIKIYQVYTQKLLKQMTCHFGPIRCIDFNPNNTSFSTASQDGFVKIHYFNTIPIGDVIDMKFGNINAKEINELLLMTDILKIDNVDGKIMNNLITDEKEETIKYPVGHNLHTVDKSVKDYTVIRTSTYEPKQTTAVRITNLPDDIDEGELWDMFEFYGRIEKNGIKVKKMYNDTIAFVNYLNSESAHKAIEKCDKKRFGYCVINVELAKF